MVKVEGLTREEVEKREKESKLVAFLKENTPKGFNCPSGNWFFVKKRFSLGLLGEAAFQVPASSSYEFSSNSYKIAIRLDSPKYLSAAEEVAQKIESIGVEQFYQTPKDTQVVIKKNYVEPLIL